jgi:carbamoyl-phosphate synthase small subunit
LAEASLQQYLEQNGIVAIEVVDTRALVTHIRTKGAMNCVISSVITDLNELKRVLDACVDMNGLELASTVGTTELYEMGNPVTASCKIAVIDYGVKHNILKNLEQRSAYLKVFPAKTPIATIQEMKPDGYILSNGPGDPAALPYAVETVKALLAEIKPLFGICLGHQLLALANGIPSFKMHHGHRGLNHPVKNVITGKSEIKTQNHGFGVEPNAVKAQSDIEITHFNLNDEIIEGIRLKNKPAFSVQYHPESTPGPHDSRYLFDDFIALVQKHKN